MPVNIFRKSHSAKSKYVADQGVEPLSDDPHERLVQRIERTHIERVAIERIKPNLRNAKKHPAKQISLLAENIKKFGFTNPLLIDEDDVLLCGHARLEAAKRSKLTELPVIRLTYLSGAEKRALAIADNKLAELGEWDLDILEEELKFLFDPAVDLTFDPEIIGFDTVEVDQILTEQPEQERRDPADQVEPIDTDALPVTRLGDLWVCGEHAVLCGNALEVGSYRAVLNGTAADLVFADFPYNVPNAGHVTDRQGVREFPMAHGEMTAEQFTEFLHTAATHLKGFSREGAVHYYCIDWRHLYELLTATKPVFGEPKNTIVWAKTNAGMGSFYRSQHEFILVCVTPGAPPVNNFGLGSKGRYRSNLWRYPGFNAFGRDRDKSLAMHPTLKPVRLVADALMDCSNRGDIVLDPFAGSGTTMIAAERTGRRARLIELDSLYCDLIVRRWQAFTGELARLADTDKTFDEVSAERPQTQ